jgi:WD40 repeat protein
MNAAMLWDTESMTKLQTFQRHSDEICAIAISHDGTRVLTGSNDNTAILWDGKTAQKTQIFKGHSDTVTAVALDDDGKRVFTASDDGTVRIWDVTSGAELCRLVTLNQGKDWLVATPDGRYDGTPDAAKMVKLRIEGQPGLAPLEKSAKELFRPGLLASIWNGKPDSPK